MLTSWNLKKVCGTQKFPDMAIVELHFGSVFYYTSSMPAEKAGQFIGKLKEGLTVKEVGWILTKGGEELRHPTGNV
jgi:hypothetical protein